MDTWSVVHLGQDLPNQHLFLLARGDLAIEARGLEPVQDLTVDAAGGMPIWNLEKLEEAQGELLQRDGVLGGDEVNLLGRAPGTAIEFLTGQVGLLHHIADATRVELTIVYVNGDHALDAFDDTMIVSMAPVRSVQYKTPGAKDGYHLARG